MGVMIEGVFHEGDPGADTTLGGAYERSASTIRNWITAEGAEFSPDAGRYHLYAAWNCPWAHRALLARAILGLQDIISVSYARPRRTDQGWVFDADGPFSDAELGVTSLHQVYARQKPAYTGRLTVPVIWDKHTESIVSNESSDIVRMLTLAYDPARRLYPGHLAPQIDRWNEIIYPNVNNGVYKAGFARTQAAYDAAVVTLFESLDLIEEQLSRTPALTGAYLTEADLRLFPTLARFDVAYHYAFKCNIRRIMDYPNLWDYARAIFALPGIAQTVNFDIYKQGYFSASELRNPLGIVPMGPEIDWTVPSARHLSLIS